ncbi:Gfo/Idh/MocA family protein [Rugosimonospora africana]|uniref:Oxidoreductase n=1 Tax=Rugosimonospora africana TaxID=556532 RepID=A0A8J3QVK2_9ACTN|nr:Gfo/Idh/MocA family oxidoreductase [Rugosimonospora africana]GIH16583.1 oxidoreductase [Rugosimonospora africana]
MADAPIRALIVGYGLGGSVFHAPLLHADPAYTVAGIVTGDPDRTRHATERYPGVPILPSLDRALAEAHYDLAVIAAPTPRHVELAWQALEAGLATVVDKPLAVRVPDAQRLITLAEHRGVALTVFQNRRWDGDFLTVRRLIDEGHLGDVWRFESRFEWLNPRPRPAWKSATGGPDGGGVAYDLGSHLVDQAIELFGPVTQVYGELDRHREGAANDDDSFIALTHAGGVRSHVAMSSLVAQRGARFRVLGSASAYTKWGLDPQEAQLASGMSPSDDRFGVEPVQSHGLLGRDGQTVPVPSERGGYRQFYARLAEALAGRGPLPVDPRDVLATLRVIEELHARR